MVHPLGSQIRNLYKTQILIKRGASIRPFAVALLVALLFGCATTPRSPVMNHISLDKSKDAVFHAALLALQEGGADILTVDAASGVLATKNQQWQITENMTLHYRTTVFVKALSDNSTEVRVNVFGEKYFSDGSGFPVNETDNDVRGLIEATLWSIQSKLN